MTAVGTTVETELASRFSLISDLGKTPRTSLTVPSPSPSEVLPQIH
jgi:hypothetical protein